MAIRTGFKCIADKYDQSLVNDRFLRYKPQDDDLDKHGIDAIDNNCRRVDTKYPESINQFYFQVSKIFDDDYTWTEDYWYIFHDNIYKWHRNDLKSLVNQHKDKWTIRSYKDGYKETVLPLSSICDDPLNVSPFEVVQLPYNTAKLIEKDIIQKNMTTITGVKDYNLQKWPFLSSQNYCCEDFQMGSDQCFRFKKYEKIGRNFREVLGVYYKLPREIALKHRFLNGFEKKFNVLSKAVIESIGHEYCI